MSVGTSSSGAGRSLRSPLAPVCPPDARPVASWTRPPVSAHLWTVRAGRRRPPGPLEPRRCYRCCRLRCCCRCLPPPPHPLCPLHGVSTLSPLSVADALTAALTALCYTSVSPLLLVPHSPFTVLCCSLCHRAGYHLVGECCEVVEQTQPLKSSTRLCLKFTGIGSN